MCDARAPQQELFLPLKYSCFPGSASCTPRVPSSWLGPCCSWDQALPVSPSTLQPGWMEEEPIHCPTQSSFSSPTSSWNSFYRRMYAYTYGSCYFPFSLCYFPLSPGLLRSLKTAQVCPVLAGLTGLFDGQGRVLDLEKPQFLESGYQEGCLITPHPLLSCWTLCVSRELSTVPSPGVLLPMGHTLPISVLL